MASRKRSYQSFAEGRRAEGRDANARYYAMHPENTGTRAMRQRRVAVHYLDADGSRFRIASGADQGEDTRALDFILARGVAQLNPRFPPGATLRLWTAGPTAVVHAVQVVAYGFIGPKQRSGRVIVRGLKHVAAQ